MLLLPADLINEGRRGNTKTPILHGSKCIRKKAKGRRLWSASDPSFLLFFEVKDPSCWLRRLSDALKVDPPLF